MIATLQARESDREAINDHVAAFLARGGKIKTETASVDVMPWPGNNSTARKTLKQGAYLAAMLRMSMDNFLILAREPNFPQCYLFEGERNWCVSHVKAWWRKYRMHG